MDAMKEVNKVLSKEGKYASLTDVEIDKIFKDTDDYIFQRTPPDDLAQGGRVGFKTGGIANRNMIATLFNKS